MLKSRARMNIIDALRGEHGVFYALFTHMERCVPAAVSLPQVKIQGSLLAAALISHAHLEELLFTTLEPNFGHMGPLVMMRGEHERIENSLDRLLNVEELREAQDLLLQIVAAAREHFIKEERVVFLMAAEKLSTETLTELGAKWAARRGVALA